MDRGEEGNGEALRWEMGSLGRWVFRHWQREVRGRNCRQEVLFEKGGARWGDERGKRQRRHIYQRPLGPWLTPSAVLCRSSRSGAQKGGWIFRERAAGLDIPQGREGDPGSFETQ